MFTRKIMEKDSLIEAARDRAARAADLAARVSDHFKKDSDV